MKLGPTPDPIKKRLEHGFFLKKINEMNDTSSVLVGCNQKQTTCRLLILESGH
jgi:hypothetical protein